jgi:hypothetical protein
MLNVMRKPHVLLCGFVALLILFWIPRAWWWLPPVVIFAAVLAVVRGQDVRLTPLTTAMAAMGAIAVAVGVRLLFQ